MNFIKAVNVKKIIKPSASGSIIKTFFNSFALLMLSLLAEYYFTFFISRNLGAEIVGIFSLSLTVLNIFVVFGKQGLDMFLLRFMARYSSLGEWGKAKEIYYKIINIALISAIFYTILLYAASGLIATKIFNKDYLKFYLQIISLMIIPATLLSINTESLRGLKKTKEYVFIQNTMPFLIAGLLITIIYQFKKSTQLPFYMYGAGLAISCLVSFRYLFKNKKLVRAKKTADSPYKKIFSVSIPMLITSSVFMTMSWIDKIMLGYLSTDAAVGIYSVAFKTAQLTQITLFAVNSITASKFSEYFSKNNMQSLKMIVENSSKLIFWSSAPILLLLFIFPEQILAIYGTEFIAGKYALLLLTAGAFINSISGSVGYLLQMTGNHNLFLKIILISAIINVLLNAVLIPKYGINGAALASMISMAIWNLTSSIFIKHKYKILTLYFPLISKLIK